MKKFFFTMLIAIMLILLTACSMGSVSEKQIHSDMNEYFSAEKFDVISVKVERSRRVDKTDTIDVSVEVEGEDFTGERWYELTYNKYSRGGWQLDICTPMKEEKWTARTENLPDISKETLAGRIFCKEDVRGGYSLNKNIVRAKFKDWTAGAKKDERGPERFITNIKQNLNADKNVFIAEVTISAKSKILQIEEVICFEWYLNVHTFDWEEPYIYSTCERVIANVDLNGKYVCRDTGGYTYLDNEIKTAVIKSFGDDERFLYKDHEYVIEGLFYACYDAGDSIKYLKITDDAICETPYGWVIYYDDKINNSESAVLKKEDNPPKLVIGTNAQYPPFEYRDANKSISGFDIDLIRLICKELGYELEIKDMEFDSLIASLENDKIDVIISGMSITDERKQYVDFSVPYITYEAEYDGDKFEETYSIAVEKNSEILDEIDGCIMKYQNDGTIDKLKSKYNID